MDNTVKFSQSTLVPINHLLTFRYGWTSVLDSIRNSSYLHGVDYIRKNCPCHYDADYLTVSYHLFYEIHVDDNKFYDKWSPTQLFKFLENRPVGSSILMTDDKKRVTEIRQVMDYTVWYVNEPVTFDVKWVPYDQSKSGK